jgi:thiol-disulfide isomerase/thioredoxin
MNSSSSSGRTLALLLAAHVVAAPEARANVDVYANPNTLEGQTPALKVGDTAPALTATAWINGQPVPRFARGTVYLVEFWATWCQPCQKSLPRMNALQKTYRGRNVRVVGVAAAEEGGLAGLEAFVKGTPLGFPVAYVEGTGVFDDWMHAARASGLPWVFIVDRSGRVAWWGQPFDEDFEGVVRRAARDELALRAEAARRTKGADRARRGWALKSEVWAAHRAGDRERTLALIDELVALDAGRFWAEVSLKTRMLLERREDRARGMTFARLAVDQLVPRNPHALTQIAQAIRGLSDAAPTDLALAARAASRASQLTGGADEDVRATLESITALQAKAGGSVR